MSHRLLLRVRLGLILLTAFASSLLAEVPFQFKDAAQARIDGAYASVLFTDGKRTLVPLEKLRPEERSWLTAFAAANPLPKGKSQVTVVKAEHTVPLKKTIEIAKIENGVETVRLCPPNVMRDQIGGTCMLYARVHWLDICGYYLNTPEIYKIINNVPPDEPYRHPGYYEGIGRILSNFNPAPRIHNAPTVGDPADWARAQLRLGRPVLAALPREIWQALPPGFVATRIWSGGRVGHQIVVNGFTWNPATRKGTFHVINSWAELDRFDLDASAVAEDLLVFEQSMSPKGEPASVSAAEAPAGKILVKRVTSLRAVGANQLFEVETDRGVRKVVAADAAAARALVEAGD